MVIKKEGRSKSVVPLGQGHSSGGGHMSHSRQPLQGAGHWELHGPQANSHADHWG